MDLDVVYQTLNFFVNKATGQYFTPGQLDQITDVAQMSVFDSFFVQFLKSQRIDDALAPFFKQDVFNTGNTPNGILTAPADYLHCQALYTIVQDAQGNTRQRPVVKLNADELAGRLNSQILLPTVMDPVYVTIQNWGIQLYPQQPQAGIMFYLSRPPAPKYSYTTATRGVTYNQAGSTQLAWSDSQILTIIMKALSAIGVNTREKDVLQWAESKETQDISTPNKL